MVNPIDSVSSSSSLEELSTSSKELLESIDSVKAVSGTVFSALTEAINSPCLTPETDKVESTYSLLKSKGFEDLAERIKGKNGFPWDNILMLDDPQIIEQFVDIYEILTSIGDPILEDDQRCILDFAFQLSEEHPDEVHFILAQLILALSTNPLEVSAQIATKNKTETILWLSSEFEQSILQIKTKLSEHYQQHALTRLQDGEIAIKNALPRELSHLLISKSGKVNIGIIPYVLEHFPSTTKPLLNFDINLTYGLQQLMNNPSLREKLSRISTPLSPQASATVVIRTSLGLPPTTLLTDVEAIKTTFTALISHLRQGAEGSCFATPLAIKLLSSDLDQCLDDFASLLKYNKLTRKVESITRDFPFLLRMGENNFNQQILIEKNEFSISKQKIKGELWEVPAFIAVCQEIGITDPSIPFQDLIQKSIEENKAMAISVKQILQHLTKYAAALDVNNQIPLNFLYIRACFAFQAQEGNPLLRSWENAISSMAEAGEGSMIKTAIINSISEPLNTMLDELLENSPLVRKELSALLRKLTLAKIHLQYDPLISHHEVSIDQHSSEGAFVLYEKDREKPPTQWLRIDRPTRFQQFVLNLLKDVDFLIQHQHNLNQEQKEIAATALSGLLSYVSSNEFLLKCLTQYYPGNSTITDPLNNYKAIKYSPWVTKSGNNFSKVIQTYTQNFQQMDCEHFVPKDSEDLFKKLIFLGRNTYSENNNENKDNPQQLISARIIGLHAFSLMLGHPSLSKVWKSKTDPSKWIEKNVTTPSRKISDSPINNRTKNRFSQIVIDQYLSKSQEIQFKRDVAAIPKKLSIKVFRKKILKVMKNLFANSKTTIPNLPMQIDTAIVESLPKKLRKALVKRTIHFADSNWNSATNDIHFVFIINPGNGKLELWGCSDDGSDMFALDQNLWVNGRDWEVFV